MEQSKSPKALAYANLGKRQSAKPPAEESRKAKRDSTGIYEELLDQIPQEANSYIRDLVRQNEKESSEPNNNHSRRKSYAQIVIDSSSKERGREERETLCRPKITAIQTAFLQQATPKNSTLPLNKRSNKNGNNSTSSLSQSGNIMINSFKKEPVKEQSFLDHLSNYLQELTDSQDSSCSKLQVNGCDKLSQTLKISSGQNQSFRLVCKLQQSHLKIKQLKLKNYYQQKEMEKFSKKEQKMLSSLREMYGQIKHLSAQLSHQKQERKKLERVIDNFQMRRNQPERKTIGKHHLNIDRLNDINTEFENDCDSSFREWKNSTNKRSSAIKICDQARTRAIQGVLDSDKIEKLFRSNYNSDESED